ncbi:hypothetical protein SG34_014145 [Thalassomonas viridans]|uniref:Uncharacterized protein n=1 Tax=Thalassomonas viridans TaxID=137584 RepID=A0AAE9ZAF1_9GAMM|nr:hypothetical protein [Thalassomonas viridans]WDE07922.1 hypothetical protein SG34_014145 [Thalassomonas viridans]
MHLKNFWQSYPKNSGSSPEHVLSDIYKMTASYGYQQAVNQEIALDAIGKSMCCLQNST